jgi:YaiO family outer membrane protein
MKIILLITFTSLFGLFLIPHGFSQDTGIAFEHPEDGFALMRKAASEGDYPGAKRIASQLLEANPDYHDVSIYLSRVYGWNSQYDSAFAILEDVISKAPGLTDAYLAYVDLCYWQNDWEKLKSVAEKAIEVTNSDDVRARYALALYHTGELQQAISQADTVLEHDPANSVARDVRRLSMLESDTREWFGHYSYDFFSEPYLRRWHMLTAGMEQPFSFGKIIPFINAGTNAGGDAFKASSDVQFNLESYIILTKKNYMLAGYGISPGKYFPSHRAILDVWQTLPAGFAVSAGVRYFYWESHFFYWNLGVEKYHGNYWFALKNYLFFKDYGASSSHYLTARRYLNSSKDNLSLTLGYGTAPDEPVVVISDLDRLNAASVRADLSKLVRSSVRLYFSFGYSYEEFEKDQTRNRFNFSAGAYFKLR